MVRIAIINKEKCSSKECGDFVCKRVCPVNRQGKECIVTSFDHKAQINEELCIGCGICVPKCPFKAIDIINLPESLKYDPIHRFGKNQFALFSLPTPVMGKVVGIIGRNGIGKSTAIKILSGNLKPNFGETKEASYEEIQPGYIVERHLMDGDLAIFNRQPSLHRMSMMCHRVRVLPGKTLRLNPAVCHPYNADFDGDEMNLHIPQTEEARAEAEILMEVQTQLISPRYGLSIIGCVQDAISGNYLLTKDKTELKKEGAIDILTAIGVTDLSKLPRKEKIKGKELFSVLIPDDFNFTGRSRHYDSNLDKKANTERDAYVVIKDGILISGVMDRNNLGEGSGLLLRNIHKKYGKAFTIDLLGKLFRLGIEYLLRIGFSTAISDTDLPEEAKLNIKEVMTEAEKEVSELINLYYNNKMETFPGKTLSETVELKILEVLNRARNVTGQLVSKHSSQNSPTKIMADSGARGNLLNLAQMAACVGQQAMRGKRIEKGYRGRTLSCFKRGDLSSDAHGFIKSGFKNGLSPHEFFFGSITGRDSLMDTALRTPKSGYLYRRLANALQDLKVEYDHTVRDASGKIVQFEYGEDRIDVSKSEGGIVNVRRILKTVGV